MLGDPDDGADVAADVFARAFDAMDHDHGPAGRALPWLLVIARRLVIDRWRRRRLIRWLPLPIGRSAPAGDAADRGEFWIWLAQLAAALPERQRELIFLRYREDLTDAEIGTVDGPVGVGRALARRAGHPVAARSSRAVAMTGHATSLRIPPEIRRRLAGIEAELLPSPARSPVRAPSADGRPTLYLVDGRVASRVRPTPVRRARRLNAGWSAVAGVTALVATVGLAGLFGGSGGTGPGASAASTVSPVRRLRPAPRVCLRRRARRRPAHRRSRCGSGGAPAARRPPGHPRGGRSGDRRRPSTCARSASRRNLAWTPSR